MSVAAVIAGSCALLFFRSHARSTGKRFENKSTAQPQVHLTADYYFNVNGNDSTGDGSIAHPWRSIHKLDDLRLHSGDRLLFAGGQVFTGKLLLDGQRVVAGEKPLLVGSYGSGSATITNTTGDAIEIHNLGNIELSQFVLIGGGRNAPGGDGIHISSDLPAGSVLDHILVHRMQISGFVNGLEMVAIPKDRVGKCGYRNVTIANCSIHDNAQDGLFLRGNFSQTSTQYSFSNVSITGVVASSNYHTVPGVDDENGIDVSDCDNAVIQYCTAFNNGFSGNGGVGIWTWDCNRSVIQYCLAFCNHTGRDRDGDGFDLDGGDTNSVMQYDLSFGNDGAGLALFQFKYGRPFHANAICKSVSINDGRKNAYGGIAVGDYGPGISNCEIDSNFVAVGSAADAKPSALQLETPTSNLRIRDNTFVTSSGIPLLWVVPGQKRLLLSHNWYFTTGNPVIDWQGTTYKSLVMWINSKTGEQ